MKLPFLRRTGAGNRVTVGDRLRQLALLGLVSLAGCYLAGITGGYLWLRYQREVEGVSFFDVALLRVQPVRRAIGKHQFGRAKKEWAAKNYQAAYVAYASAVRQDPDNVPGRLEAVDFLRAVGAPVLAQNLLEEGLTRATGDRRLLEPAFNLLISTGGDRRALELLRKLYPADLSGENGLLLQTYELLATLTAEGPLPAQQLLGRHPALLQHPPAAPVIARILWERAERAQAITLLAGYVGNQSAPYDEFVRLVNWQIAAGQPEEARKTAERAAARFPADLPPKVLVLETRAMAAADGRPAAGEIEAFLRENSSRAEALPLLAQLAGKRGWVDLARITYELGVARHADLMPFAFSYSDALMTRARFPEAGELLAQMAVQAPEDNLGLAVQLRQRQIIAAAAAGAVADVREFARRLGSLLSNYPDGLEACRRLFLKLGIPDAVIELAPRASKPRPAVPVRP